MTRKIHYMIEEKHSGKPIGEFLKEKEYSRTIIIELKKTPVGIQKNGKMATVNELLRVGDYLDITLSEEVTSENIVPNACEIDILYEDEDLLVVNKDYNMPIHPSMNHYEHTLANSVIDYFNKQGKNHVFRCINRLDRDTTGITIIAKNMLSASILAKRMERRQLFRTYIAFVEGVTPEEGCIDFPIGRVEGSIIERKVDLQNGKTAITHYKRLQTLEVDKKQISIVELHLETGRTHQIRVHMSYMGYPLLGDFLYNPENHMLTRQGLHASKMVFHHPITNEKLCIEAPLPKDMAMLLERANQLTCSYSKTE